MRSTHLRVEHECVVGATARRGGQVAVCRQRVLAAVLAVVDVERLVAHHWAHILTRVPVAGGGRLGSGRVSGGGSGGSRGGRATRLQGATIFDRPASTLPGPVAPRSARQSGAARRHRCGLRLLAPGTRVEMLTTRNARRAAAGACPHGALPSALFRRSGGSNRGTNSWEEHSGSLQALRGDRSAPPLPPAGRRSIRCRRQPAVASSSSCLPVPACHNLAVNDVIDNVDVRMRWRQLIGAGRAVMDKRRVKQSKAQLETKEDSRAWGD